MRATASLTVNHVSSPTTTAPTCPASPSEVDQVWQTAGGVGITPATYLTFVTGGSFLTFQTCATLAGMTDAPPPADQPDRTGKPATTDQSKVSKIGLGILLVVVSVLLAVVITAPIALSSGELVRWASSLMGLGLDGWWPWLVFIALDCAAFSCVLLSVYCAFRGKGAGVFGLLVWVFAGFSAFANYRHGVEPGAPRDAWWFFPVMSILGPGLLEAVTHFVRHQIQTTTGKRAGTLPKFGLTRWLPIIGAPRDTFGARRTAQILGISTVDEAVATYHALCPDGSLGVVAAIRARDVAAAEEAARVAKLLADEAAKVARAALRSGGVTVDQLADHQPTNGATVLRSVAAAAATSGPARATIRAAVGGGHPTEEPSGPVVHSDLAIADAATIRRRWPDGVPSRGAQRMVRAELEWHAGKATNALRAYQDQADLTASAPSVEG